MKKKRFLVTCRKIEARASTNDVWSDLAWIVRPECACWQLAVTKPACWKSPLLTLSEWWLYVGPASHTVDLYWATFAAAYRVSCDGPDRHHDCHQLASQVYLVTTPRRHVYGVNKAGPNWPSCLTPHFMWWNIFKASFSPSQEWVKYHNYCRIILPCLSSTVHSNRNTQR